MKKAIIWESSLLINPTTGHAKFGARDILKATKENGYSSILAGSRVDCNVLRSLSERAKIDSYFDRTVQFKNLCDLDEYLASFTAILSVGNTPSLMIPAKRHPNAFGVFVGDEKSYTGQYPTRVYPDLWALNTALTYRPYMKNPSRLGEKIEGADLENALLNGLPVSYAAPIGTIATKLKESRIPRSLFAYTGQGQEYE